MAALAIYGFAFVGSWLLGAMHISLDEFRVAGAVARILGVTLAALSIQLVIDGFEGSFGLA